jgi:7-cyano-7-deazaguanine synthase
MLGYPAHCGRCPQCRKRRAAFVEAGVAEPEGFYRA